MSFGFPAYSNGSQTFQVSQHQLIEITAKALKQLGWRHSNPFPNSFLVHNTVNIWSWGKKIRIDIADEGTVSVSSKCAVVTQCFDWGKNKRNVEKFFEKLAQIMAAYPAPQLLPIDYGRGMTSPVERLISSDPETRR